MIPRVFAGALATLAAVGTAAAADGQARSVGIVYRGELDDLRLAIAHETLPFGSKIAIVTAPDGLVLCCAVAGAAYILRPDEFDPVYLDDEGKTTYALDAGGIAGDVAWDSVSSTRRRISPQEPCPISTATAGQKDSAAVPAARGCISRCGMANR